MKHTLLSLFLLASIAAFGQNPTDTLTREDLTEVLRPLKNSIRTLQGDVGKLRNHLAEVSKRIDSLRRKTAENSSAIAQTASELGVKITKTEENADQKISKVGESLGKNSLYGIIGVLLAVLASVFLYFRLSKRQKADKSDVVRQLSQTKANIEESLVREFAKQTEAVEKQLLESQKPAEQTDRSGPAAEPDHSLALKVAGEINLIERNISLMDKGTRGLKQLLRSVGKLKDNLSANGYEIPELAGKPFNKGMNAIVTNLIPDESIEKDREIITKVLIPQVNYNNKMIQNAQIEVSVGI